jgi:hypothetical protein
MDAGAGDDEGIGAGDDVSVTMTIPVIFGWNEQLYE